MTEETVARIEDCPLTRHVERMEAFIGRHEWSVAAEFVTSDVYYQVAHREPKFGIGGIKEYMEWQYSLVHWDGHDTRMKFSRGNVVIIEVLSHFTRLADQAELLVPCTDVYAFTGDLISDWRVYADTSVFTTDARTSAQ
ncbi:MAG: hypothetical protein AAGB04_13395 [Pseudomonadota bacterium]